MQTEQAQKRDSGKTKPKTANQQAATGWYEDDTYQDTPKPIGGDDQVN